METKTLIAIINGDTNKCSY